MYHGISKSKAEVYIVDIILKEYKNQTNWNFRHILIKTNWNFRHVLKNKTVNNFSKSFSLIYGRKTIVPFLFNVNEKGDPIAKEERMISVNWISKDEFINNCTHENVKNVVWRV